MNSPDLQIGILTNTNLPPLASLHAIVAVSRTRPEHPTTPVIGLKGSLPWGRSIKADLRHFRELTTPHTCIMGRKVYDDLPRPLRDRPCIVLTRQPHFTFIPAWEATQGKSTFIAHSLEDALKMVKTDHAFIIGGAALYDLALPLIDTVHLTVIHADYEGDTFLSQTFMDTLEHEFRTAEEQSIPAGKDTPHELTFYTLKRIRQP